MNAIIACLPRWACWRSMGVCLLTHAQHAARANGMNDKMVILLCVHSEGTLLFGMERCRDRRVDVCEIHHTAGSLAQWSVPPPSPHISPYTFLSPLLRAGCLGLLFKALSSYPVTGSMTEWHFIHLVMLNKTCILTAGKRTENRNVPKLIILFFLLCLS